MASPNAHGVVRCPKSEYGDAFTADLLEQYKVYVGSAETRHLSREIYPSPHRAPS